MSFKLNNITKRFRNDTVLKNFSINFPDKGIVCLFGNTGIGKTTLLNIMSGLVTPDEGEIIDFGDKKFSFVFQDERLLLLNTVKENIEVVQRQKCIRTDEILKKIGLDHFSNVIVNSLSKGQRQKLSIARALSVDFDILLLDEPFMGLDEKSREDMIKLICEMAKDKLTVFVTHSVYEAVRLSDEIYILNGNPMKIVKNINVKLSFENRKKYNIDFINYQEQLRTVIIV